MQYDPNLVQTHSSDESNDSQSKSFDVQPPKPAPAPKPLVKPKGKRTVAEARDHLYPPKIAPVAWGTARRSLHYGATANQVRKRLVRVDFCGYGVYVHKLVAGPLERVEKRIRDYERKHSLVPWEPDRIDCFNWRPVRGGTSLSHHAHAVAIDIDPKHNLYHPMFHKTDTTNIPQHVIQAFTDEGWTWGGNWNSPLDPQHFQWR